MTTMTWKSPFRIKFDSYIANYKTVADAQNLERANSPTPFEMFHSYHPLKDPKNIDNEDTIYTLRIRAVSNIQGSSKNLKRPGLGGIPVWPNDGGKRGKQELGRIQVRVRIF
jgi:hypothetical protein